MGISILPSSASTQLNFTFNFEAEIALFSDNTATHPPNRESIKMEQDFKVFTGLGLHHLTTSTGGRVACLKLEIKLSQPQLKLKLS